MADPGTIARYQDDIEQMLDKHGMEIVIGMVATVCYEKARHVAEEWQDKHLESYWTTAGRYLERVATTKPVRRLRRIGF